MGPFIVSTFDPDCLDVQTWQYEPTCVMQPYRLLNGGTPLCLTLGDGRASDKATAATNTACPNNHADDGSVTLTSGVCRGARPYARPCDFGAGSNLWQQWKIKDSSKGRIQSMASTANGCLDFDVGGGNKIHMWTCGGADDHNQQWRYYPMGP